jgi:hypothetical protein
MLPYGLGYKVTPSSIAAIIPASVTRVTYDSIPKARSVEVVTFEPGSQIRRLETSSFSQFLSLKSICIAASVELLERNTFVVADWPINDYDYRRSGVEIITFERGSKLREIAPDAFAGCRTLRRLVIPASVEKMIWSSLPESRNCRPEIENGNPYFEVKDPFVVDLKRHAILRYYGYGSQVTIPPEIEQIDESCFRDCAFLQTLSFAGKSKLERISPLAFAECTSLHNILLPPSVKTLSRRCFHRCVDLESSPLRADSRLRRIEEFAFSGCSLLKSMVIPSALEFLGEHCFDDCNSLSRLTFAPPSHLRELLHIPPKLSGFVSIPDSVEIISFRGLSAPHGDLVLTFGSESRLVETSPRHFPVPIHYRSFVQVNSRSLKRFRLNLEFT